MSTPRPLVTIAVFSYNTARYLPALCRSIQAQSYGNFEALVFDDGSSDNSIEVVSPFLRDERFRLVAWKQNGGVGQAVVTALNQIQGDYCFLIAADDELKREFIKQRVALMEEQPEVALIHGPVELIDEAGELVPESSPLAKFAAQMRKIEQAVRRQLPPILNSGEALRLLLCHNVICAPSIFLRASTTRQLKPELQMKWNFALDWFLSLMHVAAGKLAYDPEPLVRYRIHSNSMSHHRQFNGPKLAEIRLVPLCALSGAAAFSSEAARLWTRHRKPFYALWLRRALVLKRAGLLQDAWLQLAAVAYHGPGRNPVSLGSEIARHAAAIAWYGLKESLARRRQWSGVSGLAQLNHPMFAKKNEPGRPATGPE